MTDEMRAHLAMPFSVEEVTCAIKEMHRTKSLEPDGMAPLFFQRCWDIVKQDTIKATLQVLSLGKFLAHLNHTYLGVIPNKASPEFVSYRRYYHSISLCNVLYKIVTKILENRLKVILPELISKTHSAFVLGRLIFDNILVVYEMMHHLNQKKKKGKKSFMSLKLDVNKAYDRVDQNFIEAIMQQWGFDNQWVENIMRRVRSVTFSILINREAK